MAALHEALGTPSSEEWMTAAAAFDELREPYNAAVARWHAADVALAKRTNRHAAEAALRSAYAAAVHLGAKFLAGETEDLARRARVDLSSSATTDEPAGRGTATDALEGVRQKLGLSDREIEVLALIALGRTNRQIADELFITEKTAGHHVSNILTKLTLSSRVEAAAVAHRAGLLDAMERRANGDIPSR